MDDILFERSDGILRVILNRPARKNAMTNDMYARFADALRQAAKDEAVRAVLWHSAGDAFSAGNDIGDFLKSAPTPDENPQAWLMNAFMEFDKPIVVAVQGVAVGGGTTMLTHCDFVYAGESARFQTPFIDLGLVPEFGSSYSVPARLGHLRAAELFLLAEPLTASRAGELGLVTRVVPDRDVLTIAAATAQKLAAKPIDSLRASKRLLKQASMAQLKEAVESENREFFERLQSPEVKEILTAFLRKRPPNVAKPILAAAE